VEGPRSRVRWSHTKQEVRKRQISAGWSCVVQLVADNIEILKQRGISRGEPNPQEGRQRTECCSSMELGERSPLEES
jgi:hypothetical protein